MKKVIIMEKAKNKFNRTLIKLATAVAAIVTMASCDPYYNYEVYIKNTTSQTITFSAIEDLDTLNVDIDSLDIDDDSSYFHRHIGKSVTLRSGERELLLKDGGLGEIYPEDIPWIMKSHYPRGIKIKFENGDSLVYYQSGEGKDFHSPYNQNSFFNVDKTDNELVSEYDVLY